MFGRHEDTAQHTPATPGFQTQGTAASHATHTALTGHGHIPRPLASKPCHGACRAARAAPSPEVMKRACHAAAMKEAASQPLHLTAQAPRHGPLVIGFVARHPRSQRDAMARDSRSGRGVEAIRGPKPACPASGVMADRCWQNGCNAWRMERPNKEMQRTGPGRHPTSAVLPRR